MFKALFHQSLEMAEEDLEACQAWILSGHLPNDSSSTVPVVKRKAAASGSYVTVLNL
jgi:hypothetical protein